MRRVLFLAMACLVASAAAAQTPVDPVVEVLASERWQAFVQSVTSKALREVDEARLVAACRQVLATAPQPGVSAAVDACIAAALDQAVPGSTHTPPAEWQRERRQSNERWVGIGVELGGRTPDGGLVIVTPIHGAPSQRAGVQPRDVLIEIDGHDIRALDMNGIIKRFRGAQGTRVSITLLREGVATPVVLTMTREPIRVSAVRSRALAADVAYLGISQFRDSTLEDFVRHVNVLAGSPGERTPGLVLDLRGNPGGLLDTVVQLGSLFVDDPSLPVVRLVTRSGVTPMSRQGDAAERQLTPTARTWLRTTPVVVLVNSVTYSGGEALAQFLREQAGARLMGSTTGGLASVSSHVGLAGESVMRLVTGELVSPRGVAWTRTGLEPDDPQADQLDPPVEPGGLADAALPKAMKVLAGMPRRATQMQPTEEATLQVRPDVYVPPVYVPPPPSRRTVNGVTRH